MGKTCLCQLFCTLEIWKHENELFIEIQTTVTPFSSPQKQDTKKKSYMICSKALSCLEEVRSQTWLLMPCAVNQALSITVCSSFIHSTQMYVFSTYSITGAALYRDTWARKETLKEKKVKARPVPFLLCTIHHRLAKNAQAWNIRGQVQTAQAEGGSHYSIQPGFGHLRIYASFCEIRTFQEKPTMQVFKNVQSPDL